MRISELNCEVQALAEKGDVLKTSSKGKIILFPLRTSKSLNQKADLLIPVFKSFLLDALPLYLSIERP